MVLKVEEATCPQSRNGQGSEIRARPKIASDDKQGLV